MKFWLKNKIRRLWTVYAAFGKWEGMPTEKIRGDVRTGPIAMSTDTTTNYVQEQVFFTSQAPRVFPNRDQLLSFLRAFAEHGAGIQFEYEGTVHDPDEALAILLDRPEHQTTELMLFSAKKPETRIQMLMHVGPWDSAHGGCACIRIDGTVFHGTPPPTEARDIHWLVDQLRDYTVMPTRSQLLKPGKPIPLWTIEDRESVLVRRIEASVARRSMAWGSVAALVVAGVVEIVKVVAFSG